ncbi:MAG: SusF/SusE family outer membrane protein [Dysgonamonadaceae bacterium]|nr:SusF/SusE family outer membrane protein [Dysgonamonadaceae bacterium]
MKKILKGIVLLVATTMCFSACEDAKDPVLTGSESNPEILSSLEPVVISKDNINSGNLSIDYHAGVYNVALGMASQLEIAKAGTHFSPAIALGLPVDGKGKNTFEITYKVLNAALTALELAPNVVANLEIRVKTYGKADLNGVVGEIMPVYSSPLAVTVTPFEPQASYLYTVGEFNGWNNANGPTLISPIDNGIYVGYLSFPNAHSEFLLLPVSGSWDHKWGSDDNVNLIVDGGANIKSPGAGYHQITVNLPELSIQMVPYSWGIIGSATPTGWDSDTDLTWNHETLRWEITLPLKGGEAFKLRLNNAWDVNYGITEGVVTAGGNDISVAEDGTYFVTFDEENLVILWTKQ